jgi:hypothetical protein
VGGSANDIFLFTDLSHSQRTGTGADLITDFVHGQDKVDLSAFAFTAFDTDGGSTEAGELRIFFQSATNDTMVFSDQMGFAFRVSGNVVTSFGNTDILW